MKSQIKANYLLQRYVLVIILCGMQYDKYFPTFHILKFITQIYSYHEIKIKYEK